jgi:hypothetical protein
VANLLEEIFHHGSGVRQQVVIACQQVTKPVPARMFTICNPAGRQQTGGQTTPPGPRDMLADHAGWTIAMFK